MNLDSWEAEQEARPAAVVGRWILGLGAAGLALLIAGAVGRLSWYWGLYAAYTRWVS